MARSCYDKTTSVLYVGRYVAGTVTGGVITQAPKVMISANGSAETITCPLPAATALQATAAVSFDLDVDNYGFLWLTYTRLGNPPALLKTANRGETWS